MDESLFRVGSTRLILLFYLLTSFLWIASGIHPELRVEDRFALIGFEDCYPKKYSSLIKHYVLTKLRFNPPKVTIETPIPISVASADEVVGNTPPFYP